MQELLSAYRAREDTTGELNEAVLASKIRTLEWVLEDIPKKKK